MSNEKAGFLPPLVNNEFVSASGLPNEPLKQTPGQNKGFKSLSTPDYCSSACIFAKTQSSSQTAALLGQFRSDWTASQRILAAGGGKKICVGLLKSLRSKNAER